MSVHEPFHIKSLEMLAEEAGRLGITIPYREETVILLEKLILKDGQTLPNRFAVHPMEGFDADTRGTPGKLAFRRYQRYAAGGAGLIWFEACAVVQEGRSNPHQFFINRENLAVYKALVTETRNQAVLGMGKAHQPLLILQLTHSGRYAKPEGKPAPLIAHRSPILDPLHNLPPDYPLVTDQYLDDLQKHFVEAAECAALAGFDGVDIKSCHGYLVSELHAAFTRRQSNYGGDFTHRTRFLREVFARIKKQLPELIVTTRLNVFDTLPYPYGFGVSKEDPFTPDLSEPLLLIDHLNQNSMPLLNLSMGNPYYAPHWTRPFDLSVKGAPVPDHHPLENISLLIAMTREIQEKFKALPMIGTGYSWLRQFIPHVGAEVIARGWASIIGQGRNSFAYPDAVKDLMEKGYFDKDKVCITCSRCSELMKNGGPTGCVIRDKATYPSGQG